MSILAFIVGFTVADAVTTWYLNFRYLNNTLDILHTETDNPSKERTK